MNNIENFETSQGTPIYQIPIEAFPGLWTFAYLVVHEGLNVLIDTGSGVGEAGDQLLFCSVHVPSGWFGLFYTT